ncbi:MAG: urate hydroxylase PuuD [Deltaproteobacteria bacterium]|nr:MAG: urate hydroxylase PuuD [Deltaproteobacteria bacterium]
MMDWRFAHEAIFRWVHVVAGIMWIGHLYFFNFVNGPFAATLEADTRRKVVPQLVPRALYWFRWGAAWTWVTGVLLLFLVFWWSDPAFYTGPSIVMILVTFLAFALYDALFSMEFAKDLRVGGAIGLGLVIVIVSGGYIAWAGFGYRAYVIHTGAMFGTIMAANVWMRIWPLQKKIITAVRDGTPPDPAWGPLAAARSRHNTYLSVPLVWMMINSHTTVPFASSPIYLFVMIVVGWGAVYLLYQNTPRVKGF